jgi:RNA 3'-terminal phosphate cyclase (ATP)
MGPRVSVTLDRPGFYPAGGGRLTVAIEPVRALAPLTLLERGETRRRHARAVVANLSRRIATRELSAVQDKLGWADGELETVSLGPDVTRGPGNVLLLELESTHVTEVFTGFGEAGTARRRWPSARRRQCASTSPPRPRWGRTSRTSSWCRSRWPGAARSAPRR